MATEAELGYQDAIRQVHRSVQRRLKTLQNEAKELAKTGDENSKAHVELHWRMEELKHVLQIIESLHR
ncbi:MAG: hypothetical protein K6T83_04845 [Alicyclobacillus sp.]|nr:hypothetical protein [Alicyclobacillus sp.]